jgi:hypothetical protein
MASPGDDGRAFRKVAAAQVALVMSRQLVLCAGAGPG